LSVNAQRSNSRAEAGELRRIAVIGGGRSSEHDVSRASAAGVAVALGGRCHVVALTIDRCGRWRDDHGGELTAREVVEVLSTCDLAVPMLHGPHGEDGTAAGFFDLAGIPALGCSVRAGALAMDKWVTKLIAEGVGIATAPGVLLDRQRATEVTRQHQRAWSGPLVVKPVSAGSSEGVGLVERPEALPAAIETALAHDDRVLIARKIIGREIDVAVLGRPDGTRLVPPLLEIATDTIFDTTAKYDGSADFRIPADLPGPAAAQLESAARRMYDALGCSGVVRVDFFVTTEGPVLNEVNTCPGFTEQSQVPKMFAATGLEYADLLELLIEDALHVVPESASMAR
jgi:D-alanine-D-alanine ligase